MGGLRREGRNVDGDRQGHSRDGGRLAAGGRDKINGRPTDASSAAVRDRDAAEARQLPYWGEQEVIFPSTAGTLRDPNNFAKQWCAARDELDLGEVTTHSFRKTVETLIDDGGLSARIGADQLEHSHVSMTQDRYMSRGRVHTQVANLLDRAVSEHDGR